MPKSTKRTYPLYPYCSSYGCYEADNKSCFKIPDTDEAGQNSDSTGGGGGGSGGEEAVEMFFSKLIDDNGRASERKTMPAPPNYQEFKCYFCNLERHICKENNIYSPLEMAVIDFCKQYSKNKK